MSVLQNKPLLFGITTRVLIIYIAQFVLFYVIPFFLFSFNGYYYLLITAIIFAVNMTLRKQLDNLFTLIIYYFSKKRIRNNNL